MRSQECVPRTARRWAVVLLLVGVLVPACGVGSAWADGASGGGDVTVAQTLGDRELTVVLRRVTSVPGPLHVDVVSHAGTAPGDLAVAVTPTGVAEDATAPGPPGAVTASGRVTLGPDPGAVPAVLQVDRPGPWELAIDDGRHRALIPFVVPAQVVSPAETLVYVGFVATGGLLVVTTVVAVRARRSGWVLVPGSAMVAALAMAVTAAQLSASIPQPPEPGVQTDPTVRNVSDPYASLQPPVTDWSRPPATLVLGGGVGGVGGVGGPAPVAGPAPVDVPLFLTDASTGAPVDDLVVHDGALIHLMVVGPTGTMTHLHPARVGPGRFDLRLRVPVPGHYTIAAEVARRGGGVQMLRSATGVDVAAAPGAAPAAPAAPSGSAGELRLGPRATRATTSVARLPVVVGTSAAPVAGRPATVVARVGDTAELQPWLGMAGHMIVTGPVPGGADVPVGEAVRSAAVWAHAHSMGAMPMGGTGGGMGGGTGMDHSSMGMPPENGADGAPQAAPPAMTQPVPANGDSVPDESVAAYGPDVGFTFTFPSPGRYRVWIQVMRDYTVRTVPVVLDVAPAGPAAPRGTAP